MEDKSQRNKLLFLIFAGALGIALMVIEGYQLVDFTDSTAFCGRLCHNVMYPEYTVYQASPHSRVLCSDCHVGPGATYLVKSKISGVPMIWGTITGNIDRPIPVPVKNLRPARETCEECHRPEKFTGDLLRVHSTYLTDETNTQKVDNRVMRIGAGNEKVASGIHWHIAANVWYLPLDESRQQIGWVGTEGKDGTIVTEYTDPLKAAQITPKMIEEGKRLMDCIDCHNRATHIFQTPEALIDAALVEGRIDKTLPFIKREGARALYPVNTSLEVAYQKVDAIVDFYINNYPAVYSTKKAAIDKAITELKHVAVLTTFPEMKVSWASYPNNIGHQTSEGCFRCHGKLVDSKGGQVGKTIDVSCDLCHYPIQAQ
jgi:nitrate/TMAO reductase-like tetraheme cytochrome c subunit